MRKIFWLLTMAWTVLAGVYLVYTVATKTQTQETNGILLSIAAVLIPYVFASALEGIRHTDVSRVRIVGPDRPMQPPPFERRAEEGGYVIPELTQR